MYAGVVKYPPGYLNVVYTWRGGVATRCLDHLNFANVVGFDFVVDEVDGWVKSSIEGTE